MFTENLNGVKGESVSAHEAKRVLRAKNWSYRRAALAIGVSYQHLCLVLNGHRVGTRLIPKILAMPESPRRYNVRLREGRAGRAGRAGR